MRINQFLYILSAVAIFSSCGGMKSKDPITSNTNFKTEQTSMESYDELWKKVAGHDQEGLPKSALKIVDSIYLKA